MRLNDRTWRPETPRDPAPAWVWGLLLVLLALAVGGYVGAMLLAR